MTLKMNNMLNDKSIYFRILVNIRFLFQMLFCRHIPILDAKSDYRPNVGNNTFSINSTRSDTVGLKYDEIATAVFSFGAT